jgi:hypothetical protein
MFVVGNLMTIWTQIQQQQKAICEKLKIDWSPVDISSMVAFNESLLSETLPINGLRHLSTDKINGWYLWSGGDIPQHDDRFFKPIHIAHLIELRPAILKYLGLPAGWRFQIDDGGYEDLWYDSTILVA